MKFRALGLVVLLCLALEAQAQIQVDMSIKRRMFVIYEPIVATVSVTNFLGKDITLTDSGGNNWFSFQIETGGGRLVPPVTAHYELNPLTVGAGQTVKRSVNLTELYAIRDYGLHRIRASIYYDGLGKFFSSKQESIEITEGKTMWEKTVGVPEGMEGAGTLRKMMLLVHRLPKENALYVRVIAPEEGSVLAMYALGRVLQTDVPRVRLDRDNDVHVLQLIGPKTYLYSRVGVNGEWKGQKTFMSTHTRPALKQTRDGEVVVTGGREDVPVDIKSPEIPKVSDRPPGMPDS